MEDSLMNRLFSGLALSSVFFTATASFAEPAITVTVDGKTYTCGQGVPSSTAECLIVPDGKTDRHGRLCKFYRSDGYCAFYYNFGAFIYENGSIFVYQLEKWCREKTSGQ
jgi:hypothetical protein